METTPNKTDDLEKLATETQARIFDRVVVDKFFRKIYPIVERASAETMAKFQSKQRAVEVQDLAQIACIKILKSLTKFDLARSSFKTWVYMTVRGCWFDLLGSAHEVVVEELDGEGARELATPWSAVDDQVDARLSLRLIESVIPHPTLELVVANAAGWSLQDLADMKGANVETMKSRVRVARGRIGTVLEWVSAGCVVAA